MRSVDEGLPDLADAVESADQRLSRLDKPGRGTAVADAGRRTGEDEVARQQRAHVRQPGHQVVDREDQVRGTAALEDLTARQQRALEADVVAVAELVRRDRDRADRAEPGVGLGQRELGRACRAAGTPVPRGPDRRSGRRRGPRIGAGDAVPAPADDRDDLDLPVDVALGQRTVDTGPVMQDGNFVKTSGASGARSPPPRHAAGSSARSRTPAAGGAPAAPRSSSMSTAVDQSAVRGERGHLVEAGERGQRRRTGGRRRTRRRRRAPGPGRPGRTGHRRYRTS